MFAIFITRQMTGNIKESIIPYIITSLQQLKIIDKSKKKTLQSEPNQILIQNLTKLQRYAKNYSKKEDLLLKNSNNEESNDSNEQDDLNNDDIGPSKDIYQPELESLMPSYPDTFGDYLEMVMQFGLMVFFAPAFPLAALFSLANNIIEIRSDAFKMCLLYQRPFGQRVGNIGTWQNILEVFSILGIVVNCGLLITFDVIPNLVSNVTFLQSIGIIILIEVIKNF